MISNLSNNNNNNNNMVVYAYSFSIILHEILGYAIYSKPELRDKLLGAYAANKVSYSLRKFRLFYQVKSVKNVILTTERRLINMVVISFDVELTKSTTITFTTLKENKIIDDYYIEKEYRRYIDSNNFLLFKKLKISCNDFSNINFVTREIEILFRDYRLCINLTRDTYTIQYKKRISHKEMFVKQTLTREMLFSSIEGPILTEPLYVLNKHDEVIGIASFFDSSNITIKTLYLEKNATTLYQRICPDDYTKSYPFILECEISSQEFNRNKSIDDYFNLGWRLNASLPFIAKRAHNVLPKSSKPKHISNQNAYIEKRKHSRRALFYLKFDGILATLIFYNNHFVLYNSTFSYSYIHTLPENVVYILKDYKFLVESNLYSVVVPTGLPKPNPLVIIDIQTSTFTAFKRMKIIQHLRKALASYLYPYYIFFQGEITCDDDYGKKTKLTSSNIPLLHNNIYEVILDNKNKNKIKQIIRPRPDKCKPNSTKLINVVFKLLNVT